MTIEELKKLSSNVTSNGNEINQFLIAEIIRLETFNKALIDVLKENGIESEKLNEENEEYSNEVMEKVYDNFAKVIMSKE